MRSIRDSGVLGFFTPGLLAAMPIDNRTQLFLYDSEVYQPDYSSSGCLDLVNKGDVSQLNALQLHASQHNIYFSDLDDEDYIRKLIAAHAPGLQDQSGRFVVHGDGEMLIAGVPNTGEVLHIFEPQLPITPDLSCITTAEIPDNENPNRPRSPELAREVERILGAPDEPSPLSMDVFAEWMRSQIRYQEST